MNAPLWAPVTKTTSGTAPSHGIARVTGQDTDGNLTIDSPNADNDTGMIIVLGAGAVTQNGFGEGTFDAGPLVMAYDETDGTPAAGEEWGVKSGEYRLRKAYAGFRILGGASGGLVNAVRVSPLVSDQDVEGSTEYTTDNTWEATALSLTLPTAGDYLAWFDVHAQAQLSVFVAQARFEARLYDVTNATESFNGSSSRVTIIDLLNTSPRNGSVGYSRKITTTAAMTIRVEVQRATGGSTFTSSFSPATDRVNILGYTRLAG